MFFGWIWFWSQLKWSSVEQRTALKTVLMDDVCELYAVLITSLCFSGVTPDTPLNQRGHVSDIRVRGPCVVGTVAFDATLSH